MNTKILLTGIAAIALCSSAFSDPVTPNIAVGTNPASCTESVLETTSGTSNLQASWTPNTLNLTWTSDGDTWTPNNASAIATCTYDSGITVPSNNPTKTGYTFAGWKVKAAAAPQQTGFDLSTWDPIAMYDGYDYDYGYLDSGNDADIDSEKYNLNEKEWAIEFENGVIKGVTACNLRYGSYNSPNNDQPSSFSGCIYRATGIDTEKNGSYTPILDTPWVTCRTYSQSCYDCIYACTQDMNNDMLEQLIGKRPFQEDDYWDPSWDDQG